MNGITEDIIELLGTSIPKARKIQDYIDDNFLLDWSTCSDYEMKTVIREVAEILGA